MQQLSLKGHVRSSQRSVQELVYPLLCALFLAACALPNPHLSTAYTPNKELLACMVLAGKTYNIPSSMLLDIFKEKRGETGKEYSLPDGSFDIGAFKVNSSQLKFFATEWDVSEDEAKRMLRDDTCTNVGTAAWILADYRSQGKELSDAIGLYNGEVGYRKSRIKSHLQFNE